VLVQIRCRRYRAWERWSLRGPRRLRSLSVDVGMVAAEGRGGRLGRSWRALGGRCVRHSVGFVGVYRSRTNEQVQGIRLASALEEWSYYGGGSSGVL
jgi:hypothetical protein